MANSKHHFKVYGERKKHKDHAMERSKRNKGNKHTCESHKKNGKVPTHEIATKFQVSIHAAERYAERVFGMDKRDLSGKQLYDIAKSIRDTLPKIIINEAKYNIIDNYYAVVNNNMVVTIVSIGKKK